jgi:hypothetical protein
MSGELNTILSVASSNVAGGGNTAITLVNEKYDQMVIYANDAWIRVYALLDALRVLVTSPSFPTVDIEYENVDVNLNYDLVDRPSPPSDSDLQFNEPARPVLGSMLEMPTFYLPGTSIAVAKDLFIQRVNERLLNGSTGLDTTVEQAIWDRARSRQELVNQKLYTETETYFSSRGFNLPNGAMSGRLNEIAIEIVRNDSYLNTDILTEQAKLAQANEQFMLKEAFANVLNTENMYAENILRTNKNTTDVFIAKVEEYKNAIYGQVARIENVVKVYVTKIEAYKADITAASLDLDAQVKTLEANIKQSQIKMELALKEAELSLETAKIQYGLQVESLKAGSQVAAQIAASALSSFNTSASVGFSAGAQVGFSGNQSETFDRTKELTTRSIEVRLSEAE